MSEYGMDSNGLESLCRQTDAKHAALEPLSVGMRPVPSGPSILAALKQ